MPAPTTESPRGISPRRSVTNWTWFAAIFVSRPVRSTSISAAAGRLAIWSAKYYGTRVTGVTLSRERAVWGQQWVCREGLEDRRQICHMDYRDLPESQTYEKISATGIIEHLGILTYPYYFRWVRNRLRDGSLFLNHGITHEKAWKRTSRPIFSENTFSERRARQHHSPHGHHGAL